jgi:hypothetical protein
MVGEHDHADAIGLEYGQAVEFRGDLVIGTTEQLRRLRAHFESCRAEEAADQEAAASVACRKGHLPPQGATSLSARAADASFIAAKRRAHQLYYRLDLDVVLDRMIEEPHLDDLAKSVSLSPTTFPNRPRDFRKALP